MSGARSPALCALPRTAAVAVAAPLAEETLAQAPAVVLVAVGQSLAACLLLFVSQLLPGRLLWSACFGLAVAAVGLKKRSLSPDGALAAFFVGLVSCACGAWFAAAQLAFFLSASRLTSFGAQRKLALDGSYKPGQGERTAQQVVANGGLPTLLALVYASLDGVAGAPVAAAALAYFATCAGDTWASELGVLSPTPPLLITTLKPVAAGTNGGVSVAGTLASAAGGLFVGLAFALFCAAPPAGVAPPLSPLAALVVGLLSGLAGSLVDSVLGATVQYSGVDEATGKVYNRPDALPGRVLRQVAGYDCLSNHAVNFVSATAIAMLTLGITATLGW